MIIAQHIDNRLSSGYNGSCIVTGLDSSGKSTMISTLYPKYHVHKPICWDTSDYPPEGYVWDELRWYQIHDRFYPIDSYVYSRLALATNVEKEVMKLSIKHACEELEKGHGKPMFVFYLHAAWRQEDNRNQPSYTESEENKKIILSRYLDVADVLIKLGYHTLLLLKDRMQVIN